MAVPIIKRSRARNGSGLPSGVEAPVSPGALSNRLVIVERQPDDLRSAVRRTRVPGKGQVQRIADNIVRFGCVLPVLVTPDGEIIDGHNVVAACKTLKRSVPTVVADDLSEAEVRTLRISLGKLHELSRWDDEALRDELAAIMAETPELAIFTGFTAAEIDGRLAELVDEDEGSLEGSDENKLGVDGDVWEFQGGHRLMQANARQAAAFRTLLGTGRARALISDMPYGCKIKGHASRSHDDFVDGADMSPDELQVLVEAYLLNAKPVLMPGALTYTFMDGRGLLPLMTAAQKAGQRQVALCVWDKVNPGMGSLYRQRAEFVLVGKLDSARHVNNVSLGRNRRNRSTIWDYPGMASFGAARDTALAMHPTVKPVGLIADIILDCTHRDDIVLDPFAGSGTILLAAHRTGRRAYAMEIDPVYVDVAVARMERFTGSPAIHATTRKTYSQTMTERQAEV